MSGTGEAEGAAARAQTGPAATQGSCGDIKKRSRFIDLAAAIVAPKCYLCFQALEANRPIAGGGKLACG
jgi:hypothetical protein